MKDRVSKYPGRVLMTPEDGSAPFYATMQRADEPTQPGDPLNKNTFLTDETAAMFGLDDTATPNDVLKWIGEWGNANWKLLAEYNTAGAYTFTVPDDVDELGAFILGGGGGGGAGHLMTRASKVAGGGRSGGLTQVVLKKSNGDFVSGEEIPVVVGAGGLGGVVSEANKSAGSTSGGTSTFKAVVSANEQLADTSTEVAPYGLDGVVLNAFGYGGRNIFDNNDTHIYCGAGGFSKLVISSDDLTSCTSTIQTVVTRAKGGAGVGKYSSSYQVTGKNATTPGDGGGGTIGGPSYSSTNIKITGGNGADGLVLVYGRKVV